MRLGARERTGTQKRDGERTGEEGTGEVGDLEEVVSKGGVRSGE